MTFAQSLGLNPDDYVSLTSYTHHPFYSQFAIEIQDNWRNGLSYNLPLDEFMAVMDNAVKTDTRSHGVVTSAKKDLPVTASL